MPQPVIDLSRYQFKREPGKPRIFTGYNEEVSREIWQDFNQQAADEAGKGK